jgi:hypothetical protein
VSIQASATLDGAVNQRAVTFNVKAGLSYVVLSEEQTEGNGPVKRAFTTFTSSGDTNGATAAKPAATVRFQGLRFRGPSTLPKEGRRAVREPRRGCALRARLSAEEGHDHGAVPQGAVRR